MSHNIDSVVEIKLEASMKAKDVKYLYAKYEDDALDLPENNFVNYLFDEIVDNPDFDDEELIPLKNFFWSSTCSGRYFDQMDFYVSYIIGRVEVVFVWEDGGMDSLIVQDGKIIPSEVKLQVIEIGTKNK